MSDAKQRGAGERPNILLLESDQHTYNLMGCMGHPIVRTPHMDRLAAEGALFRNAVCQTPLCMPSRVSLLSGRYAHNTGVYLNRGYQVEHMWTFPNALRDAGYHTGFVGKMHLTSRMPEADFDCPERIAEVQSFGFDDVDAHNGKVMAGAGKRECPYRRHLRDRGVFETFAEDYRKRHFERPHWYAAPSVLSEEDFHDAWIGRRTADWIRAYDDDRPFFMWANWGGPHSPWDAPGRYADMYDRAAMDAPIEDDHAGSPDAIRARAHKTMKDMPAEALVETRAQYYGLITLVDDAVGEIMKALDERGLRESTVVVYMSDHGEMLYDHGLHGKSVFYKGSVNVPLIVSWPERWRTGLATDTPVELIDLVPTFLDAAGASKEGAGYGDPLQPLLTGETDRIHTYVFSEHAGTKMVQTDRYKYVHDAQWDKPQLFDLEADPNEVNNLAGDPAMKEVENELRMTMLDWLSATHPHANSRKYSET